MENPIAVRAYCELERIEPVICGECGHRISWRASRHDRRCPRCKVLMTLVVDESNDNGNPESEEVPPDAG